MVQRVTHATAISLVLYVIRFYARDYCLKYQISLGITLAQTNIKMTLPKQVAMGIYLIITSIVAVLTLV